jgi:hypothetical protein
VQPTCIGQWLQDSKRCSGRTRLNCSHNGVLRQPLVIRNGTKADCDGTIGEIGPFRQEGEPLRTIGRCPSKIIAMPTDGNHTAASTLTQHRLLARRLGVDDPNVSRANKTARDSSSGPLGRFRMTNWSHAARVAWCCPAVRSSRSAPFVSGVARMARIAATA